MKKVAYFQGRTKRVAQALADEKRWPIKYRDAIYYEIGTGRPMRPVDTASPHYRYLPGVANDRSYHSRGGESLAHLQAKEVFCERTFIRFTSFGQEYDFEFDAVPEKERPFLAPVSGSELRFDAFVKLKNAGYPIEGAQTLAIEIKIGHAVKADKKAEIRVLEQPGIEITLPGELAKYTDESEDLDVLERRLRGLLLRDVLTHTDWIYPHPSTLKTAEPPQGLSEADVSPQTTLFSAPASTVQGSVSMPPVAVVTTVSEPISRPALPQPRSFSVYPKPIVIVSNPKPTPIEPKASFFSRMWSFLFGE